MPHLRYDHAAALSRLVDMQGFARAMRDALAATGVFPVGGIRVRGHAASSECAFDGGGDGTGDWLWLDMELRMGRGRSEAERARLRDTLYDAARAYLEPAVAPRPFALSLELREIDPAFSARGWNTVHAALARR
ncbi:MAG: 5-carboxymethyl-2-hydroxymuconate isomerase [Gemmobacter sp.]